MLIAAHGNSLRALVKYLDNVSEEEIVELNIPTGIPLVYQLNDDLKPLQKFYLGDPEAVQAGGRGGREPGKARSIERRTVEGRPSYARPPIDCD